MYPFVFRKNLKFLRLQTRKLTLGTAKLLYFLISINFLKQRRVGASVFWRLFFCAGYK